MPAPPLSPECSSCSYRRSNEDFSDYFRFKRGQRFASRCRTYLGAQRFPIANIRASAAEIRAAPLFTLLVPRLFPER